MTIFCDFLWNFKKVRFWRSWKIDEILMKNWWKKYFYKKKNFMKKVKLWKYFHEKWKKIKFCEKISVRKICGASHLANKSQWRVTLREVIRNELALHLESDQEVHTSYSRRRCTGFVRFSATKTWLDASLQVRATSSGSTMPPRSGVQPWKNHPISHRAFETTHGLTKL